MISDYVLNITPRDANFRPSLESVVRLIDFLDLNMYLDGPDRDLSSLVLLPKRETKDWEEYSTTLQQDYVGVEATGSAALLSRTALPQPIRKRYVHLLNPPASSDIPFRTYHDLCNIIGDMPRDAVFIAELGRGSRNLWKAMYYPLSEDERNRWVVGQTCNIVRGHHPIWRKVWNEDSFQKEWEVVTVKAFKIVITYRLNNRTAYPEIGELLEQIQARPEYQDFVTKIGSIIGCDDLELLGQDVR